MSTDLALVAVTQRAPSYRWTGSPGSRLIPSWTAALVVAGILTAACIAASLWKPVALDFTMFLEAGEGVAQTGVPVVYVGEGLTPSAADAWRFFGDSTHELGLWHPPLYAYSLGAGFRLLGSNQFTARLPGIVFLIATVAAIFFLSRQLRTSSEGSSAREVGALAAVLLLLNPLTVQYAVMLPDIDGTVVTFLTVAFAVMAVPYAHAPHTARLRSRLALGFAIALMLWAKLTTPVLMLAAWGLFYAIKRRGSGILLVVQVAAIGLAMFLPSWFLWCWALSINPLYPILHNLTHSDLVPGVAGALVHGFRLMRFDLTWIGVPLAMLYGWGIWKALAVRTGDARRESSLQLLATFVVVGYLVYTFLLTTSGLLPRYKFPLFPLAAVLAAEAVYGHVAVIPRWVVAFTAGVVTLASVALPDRLLVLWGKAELAPIAPGGAVRWAVWAAALLLPISLGVGCMALALRRSIRHPRNIAFVIAAAVVTVIPEEAVLSLKQSFGPYETTYGYGRQGMPGVISFLHQHYDTSRDVLYAPPDVSYYWRGRFIDARRVPASQVLASRAAQVFVVWTQELGADNMKALQPVPPSERIGDYLIYDAGRIGARS